MGRLLRGQRRQNPCIRAITAARAVSGLFQNTGSRDHDLLITRFPAVITNPDAAPLFRRIARLPTGSCEAQLLAARLAALAGQGARSTPSPDETQKAGRPAAIVS